MKMMSLAKELSSNTYPGRGIVIGRSGDGKYAVTAYFIMGRSENSRNRVFVEDGEGIRTQAFDPSKLTDPSLIIYAPVRVLGNKTIVTNGDQTDKMCIRDRNYRLLNIALVDIGAGTSDISVTRDGSIIAYGMIPLAGDEITELIVQSYLVDFNTAEQIKLSSGMEDQVTYKDIMMIEHTIPSKDVWKLTEPVVDKLSLIHI